MKGLGWETNVEYLTKKAFKILHWMMRNLKGSSKNTKERAYKTLVRPILEYASIVWDPHEVGQLKAIEKVQRKAARYVMGKHKKTESVSKLLAELGWSSLERRRKINRLCALFRTLKGENAWGDLRKKVENPNYIGRNDHQFKVKCRSQKNNVKKFSFLNRTILDWNSLPAELFEPFPKSVNVFKRRCKKYILD
jgi:hypothetical protein